MDTGRPEEVTVIVYRGRNLQGKKKGRGKFHVVFSVGNNKFKSEVIDDPEGNPNWDNEAEIAVDNPQEPLILKVKEKDDIIGQVVIPLAELPTKRSDRQRCVPLQPHKKCPNPQGELVFVAWISRKGAPQHTPEYVNDVKSKSSTLDPSSLASMSSLSGSQASLASTDVKKKSMMKKLKGKLSHSPKLGGRKLSMKSTSMMNLGPQELTVADPDLRNSTESLHSQESTNSAPKKKSGVQKLKSKFGKSPMLGRKSLTKSSSKSLSNLSMLDPEMKFSAAHGSNESLHSTKSSKSNKSGGSKGIKGLFSKRGSLKPDKPIPAQFDLSKPSSHLRQELEKEEEYGAVPFTPQDEEKSVPKKPPRGPQTHSRSSSQSSGGVEDSPFQRRHNSLKTRKRPDLSHHRSPAVLRHSPMVDENRRHSMEIGASSPDHKNRNVFAINADMNEDLWKVDEDESRHKHMIAQSPLLAKSAAINERDEDDTSLNPFDEEPKKQPLEQKSSGNLEQKESNNPFEESTSPATNPFEEPPKLQATPVLDTPSQKKKIAAPFVFSPSDDDEDEKKPPEISGVSPREGSTEGGTKITIRGEYLGKTKDDIVTLTVCGVNCIQSLEYFSSYKIMCTTGTRRPGSGKIVIETKSGGLARSTIDYIFVQPKQEAPPKPVREHKREKSQPKELLQSFLGKDPSPPKEVMAPKRDDADTKMAVVEPMSRAKVQTVQGHTRQGSGNGDLKRQAPVAPANRNNKDSQQITKDSNEDNYNKEDLLRIIRELQTENQKLKEESVTMRTYIDQMVMRVMEKCPELLAIK